MSTGEDFDADALWLNDKADAEDFVGASSIEEIHSDDEISGDEQDDDDEEEGGPPKKAAIKVGKGKDTTYEGAVVMEMKRGYYGPDKPIATLDFASLYP